MNGTDDWTGPAKATEKMDPMPESSTFGKCTIVDGKACITSDAAPTSGLGLGTEAIKTSVDVPVEPDTMSKGTPK